MLCLHTLTGDNLVEQSTIYYHKCKPHIYDIRGTSTWDITGSLKKLCSVHSTVSSIHWSMLKFKLSNTYWDKLVERPGSRLCCFLQTILQVTNEKELTFWNEEEFVDAKNGVCSKFKNPFLGFFKKKQDFVLFSKKTEKAHSELFLFHHVISLSSELHNNNLLYLSWHSKLRVKQCTPSLISQCVVGQFTPKW